MGHLGLIIFPGEGYIDKSDHRYQKVSLQFDQRLESHHAFIKTIFKHQRSSPITPDK